MEFTAPSGKTVIINPAPFKDASALKKAIERELAAIGMDNIFKIALVIDSSDAVEAALWPCLARCLRDGQKVIPETFNDIEARQDYHSIAVACAKVNIGPFVESLSSQLSDLGLTKKKDEAQKSE